MVREKALERRITRPVRRLGDPRKVRRGGGALSRASRQDEDETPQAPPSPRAHALELLGRRDFTRQGMLERLRDDGYDAEQAEDAVEYLTSSGYLDDRRFAERFLASSRAKKGHGRAWLERELRAKGVPKDVLGELLSEVRDRDTELNEVLVLAESILRREPGMERERLAARLARRGFGWDVIRAAVERLGKGTPDVSDS